MPSNADPGFGPDFWEAQMWLNTTLAVPVVGLQLAPSFSRALAMSKIVAAYADELRSDSKSLTLQQANAYSFSVDTPDSGVRLEASATDLVFRFHYANEVERTPGEFPKVRFGEPRPYSELLTLVCDHLRRFTALFCREQQALETRRLGVMAAVELNPELLPPGVEEFVQNLSRPWGRLEKSQTTLLSNLEESDDFTVRCHHILNFDKSVEGMSWDLRLDWQRLEERTFQSESELNDYVLQCCDGASDYFERFGSGEVFSDFKG